MLSSERTCRAYTAAGSNRGFDESLFLRAFFPHTASGRIRGKRWIADRERAGLFEVLTVLARPVEDVELVFYGSPEADPPDFDELSRESCRRWNIPSRPVTVIRGTPKLRNIVGGPPRMGFRALGAIGHDLGVGAVCLKLQSFAASGWVWVSEDGLEPSRWRDAQPDAVIFDQTGNPLCAIEFSGGYPSEKYQKIDLTFRSMGIPYAIYMRTKT